MHSEVPQAAMQSCQVLYRQTSGLAAFSCADVATWTIVSAGSVDGNVDVLCNAVFEPA